MYTFKNKLKHEQLAFRLPFCDLVEEIIVKATLVSQGNNGYQSFKGVERKNERSWGEHDLQLDGVLLLTYVV